MEDHHPSIPNLRENLVAYLDGELDETGTLEVEKSLTESAEIRQEVEELARTWELLDELPRVQASTEFTERTLASIQTLDDPEATQPLLSPTIRRNVLASVLMGGLVLCAVAGFIWTNQWIPQKSDPLIEDLPVIEQLDLLEDVGDVELLRELEDSLLLDEWEGLEGTRANN